MQREVGVLWPKLETGPLCVTAAWGNKEEERWLTHQYYLVGQSDCQESSYQEEVAMMPAPCLQPWAPRASSSQPLYPPTRPGEEQRRKL